MANDTLGLLKEAIDETESVINNLRTVNEYQQEQIKIACAVFRGIYIMGESLGWAKESERKVVMEFLARNDTTGWLP